MASKFKSWGAKLEIEGATPGTFVEVPQVMNIDAAAATIDEIEVTTLDNTTGYREFLPSFKDGGEISFTLAWSNALHVTPADGVWNMWQAGDTHNMRIFLPTEDPGSNYVFSGFFKSLGPGPISPDDAITFNGSIRVSGAIDIEAAEALVAAGAGVVRGGAGARRQAPDA